MSVRTSTLTLVIPNKFYVVFFVGTLQGRGLLASLSSTAQPLANHDADNAQEYVSHTRQKHDHLSHLVHSLVPLILMALGSGLVLEKSVEEETCHHLEHNAEPQIDLPGRQFELLSSYVDLGAT